MQGHAYSILDVKEVSHQSEHHQLVKLRNPWADNTEWSGDFCDKSPKWNEYLKKKLEFHDAGDGEFWMPFKDFAQHFLYVFVCRVFDDSTLHLRSEGEWKGATAAGGPANKNMKGNPQYHITVTAPTHLFITLTQEDRRKDGEAFHHIGLWLFNKKGKRASTCKKRDIVKRSSSYADFRNTTLEIPSLPPSPTPYTLVPTTSGAGEEAKFIIDIYAADSSVKLTEVPMDCPAT